MHSARRKKELMPSFQCQELTIALSYSTFHRFQPTSVQTHSLLESCCRAESYATCCVKNCQLGNVGKLPLEMRPFRKSDPAAADTICGRTLARPLRTFGNTHAPTP